MDWVKLEFSKSQVEKAGKQLITYDLDSPEYKSAVKITNNWRASHAFPLNTIKIFLLKKATQIESGAIIVQRLKRLESIKNKLKIAKLRNNSSNLSRMQDIGGCRIIFSKLDSVYKLSNYLANSPKRFKHKLLHIKDYINKPKPSGYRGIHLIYEYNSRRSRDYNGLKLEVQIRTFLQHLWATTVESTQLLTKTSLKSGVGPSEWLRFFSLMSSVFAIVEKQPTVPNTPTKMSELISELKDLDRKHQFFSKLKSYQAFVSIVEQKGISKADYYLLIIDYDKPSLKIVPYSKEELEIATEEYSEIETNTTNSNVVLISASSLSTVKKAYPNYFNDIGGFVILLNIVLYDNNQDNLKTQLEIIERNS